MTLINDAITLYTRAPMVAHWSMRWRFHPDTYAALLEEFRTRQPARELEQTQRDGVTLYGIPVLVDEKYTGMTLGRK